MLTGRSDSNKVVILEGCDELVGKMVEIKIVFRTYVVFERGNSIK